MPTYSYRCTECDHAFDIHQSFSDEALTTCPQCQGRLRKNFGNVGVVFKGSGFYRTDSRGGSGSSSPAKKDTESSSAGSKDSASGSKDSASSTPPAAASSSSSSSPASTSSASGSASAS